MGTRYEDQPVEQWAGPESLDPTPVWKQYILVALLLFVGLVVVLVFSVMALAPNFVTPPALVPGDRLVLSTSEIPQTDMPPKTIGAPLVDDSQAFLVAQPSKGSVVALRSRWAPTTGATQCPLATTIFTGPTGREFGYTADCGNATGRQYRFHADGGAFDGSYRALDRYLVSVSGDRVIVNLSRVIESSERTSGPVPTGIPQPQTQQP